MNGENSTSWTLVLLTLLLGLLPVRSEALDFSGGCDAETSPYLDTEEIPSGARITYCAQGDADRLTIRSTPLVAGTKQINLLVAGYPQQDGIDLRLVCVPSGIQVSAEAPTAGERWRLVQIDVPETMHGCEVVLELHDDTSSHAGWAGIAAATPTLWTRDAMQTFVLVLMIVVLGALWVAGVSLCFTQSLSTLWSALLGIVLLGLAGYAVAAAFFFSPDFGRLISFAMLVAPPSLAILAICGGGSKYRRAVGRLLGVLSLPTAVSILVLWVGVFPFSWDGNDWTVPANRWLSLPIDNWIPHYFSLMLQSGEVSRPLVGDWLSSDRPPLQAGIDLLFNGHGLWRAGIGYQAIATWAQLLALLPLLAMLSRGMPVPYAIAMMLCIGLGPVVFINSLFVWPKLLAAAYCGIFHLLLFPNAEAMPRYRWTLAGVCAALALLSHGGAFFALAGSCSAFLLLRHRKAIAPLVGTGATASVIYAPWVLYQRWIDPPGDRLVQWHFAGEKQPTGLSTFEAIRSAYADIDLQTWWNARLENIAVLFPEPLSFANYLQDLAIGPNTREATSQFMQSSFFNTGQSMWFFGHLSVAIFLLIAARRHLRPSSQTISLAIASGFALFTWIVLMFDPGSTVIHQGAYFTTLACLLLAMRLVFSVSPTAFMCLAAGNLALWCFIFVPGVEIVDNLMMSATYLGVAALLVAAASVSAALAHRTAWFSKVS